MLRFCFEQPDRRGRLTRRELLRVAGIGTPWIAGQSLRPLMGAEGRTWRGFGQAKSVILVYASGGQSQLDMWDPKPSAPLDIRGEFGTISTRIPGTAFCEHMPQIAEIADRLAIVRSMSHEDLDHGSATYLSLTGRYHSRLSSNPSPAPTDFPTLGAVLTRVRRTHRFPYEAVHVNGPALVPVNISPGQNGGFLGRSYEPLVVGDVTEQSVAIPGLRESAEVPMVRISQRQTLKESMNALQQKLADESQSEDLSGMYERALDMLASPRIRRAFDLSQEPDQLRNQYGRHRSGQACLLARRLAEAGVPLTTVIWNHSNRGQDTDPEVTDLYGWDTHNDIFLALKKHLLPRFDESFSTLIRDLDSRGMLEDTLVICMGEFGRAPRVALEPRFAGSAPGRKHWASVYSIAFAGAGVGRGTVIGQSDRWGAEPITERFGPWDVAATLFNALGIPPNGHFVDSLDRPFPITVGRPMDALYG